MKKVIAAALLVLTFSCFAFADDTTPTTQQGTTTQQNQQGTTTQQGQQGTTTQTGSTGAGN